MNKYYYIMVNEGIDEYVEGINTLEDLQNKVNNDGIFLYSRTRLGNINNIRVGGASREFQGSIGAHAYGFGLYTTLTLAGEQSGMECYGDTIIKHWIPGFERCLIPDGCHSDCFKGDIRQVVHGNKSFVDQVNMFVDDPKDADYIISHYHGAFSSDDPQIEKLFGKYKIDGYLLSSANWCIWKDYKRVVPYMYSTDNGKTWKQLATQDTINITTNTWEPDSVFGDNIGKYVNGQLAREHNGYFVVQFVNNRKFTIIDAKSGKEIPKIPFEAASDVNDNGYSVVRLNDQTFAYVPQFDELYSDPTSDDFEDRLEDGDCDFTTEELASHSNINERFQRTYYGRLLTESLEEYIENVDKEDIHMNNNDMVYFYRLSLPEQIQSIAQNGFSKEFRGTGNDNTDWIGSGTYGNQYPRNNASSSYGNILWCYGTPKNIVQNHYIAVGEKTARKYGINGNFAEQLHRFFPDYWEDWKENGKLREILRPEHSESATFRKFLTIAFRGGGGKSDNEMHKHGVKGVLYHGNIDGDAVLTLDDTSIIPIAWKDLNKHNDQWHTVEISDSLWNKTYNGYDPLAVLNGEFDKYADGNQQTITNNYRVINGFMLVQTRKDKKYFYVKAKSTGETECANFVGFDAATDVDDNGLSQVILNGERFLYIPQYDELYKFGEDIEEHIENGECDYTTEELTQ